MLMQLMWVFCTLTSELLANLWSVYVRVQPATLYISLVKYDDMCMTRPETDLFV